MLQFETGPSRPPVFCLTRRSDWPRVTTRTELDGGDHRTRQPSPAAERPTPGAWSAGPAPRLCARPSGRPVRRTSDRGRIGRCLGCPSPGSDQRQEPGWHGVSRTRRELSAHRAAGQSPVSWGRPGDRPSRGPARGQGSLLVTWPRGTWRLPGVQTAAAVAGPVLGAAGQLCCLALVGPDRPPVMGGAPGERRALCKGLSLRAWAVDRSGGRDDDTWRTLSC